MTAASRNLMEKGCERIGAAIMFMNEMGESGWAEDVSAWILVRTSATSISLSTHFNAGSGVQPPPNTVDRILQPVVL